MSLAPHARDECGNLYTVLCFSHGESPHHLSSGSDQIRQHNFKSHCGPKGKLLVWQQSHYDLKHRINCRDNKDQKIFRG